MRRMDVAQCVSLLVDVSHPGNLRYVMDPIGRPGPWTRHGSRDHRYLNYQVLPICLPPHMTHFLQPLDVAVFGPLKHAYSDLLQAQYMKGERGVWKGNFYKLLDSAQEEAFTSTNILSGFRHTGLWPVDFSVVEERMNFSGLRGSVGLEISHQDQPVTLPLHPLFSLSPGEVHQISTPRNPHDVHLLHNTISTEFSQPNKFEDWATRYAMEKLANSATAALHKRDGLQKWLKINAEKQ